MSATKAVASAGAVAFTFGSAAFSFPDRPFEWWAALFTGCLIVFALHKGKPAYERALMVAISAGIGLALQRDFASWVNRSENISVFFLVVFGYPIVDVLSKVVADTTIWKTFVEKYLGTRK